METNTLVIGGGPGGYAAAIRLGQLGVDTVLVEENKLGGTCLNVGCIPSKALLNASGQYYKTQHEFPILGIESKTTLDWKKTIEWKEQLVQKVVGGVEMLVKANKVKLIYASAVELKENLCVLSNQETVSFQNAILATGSSIVELKDFPFDHKKVLNSTDLLRLDKVPSSLILLGGGIIGMELGTVYLSLGTQVTIVEMLPRILPMYEEEASMIVHKNFVSMGGTILTNTKALGFTSKGSNVLLEIEQEGQKKTLSAEKMAVAVGRKPNLDSIKISALPFLMEKGRILVDDTMRSSVKNIYAIGDLVPGPMLAHKATMEGVLAAEAIAGHKVSRQDVKVIADVVYTKPEIAQVGLNADMAKEQGLETVIGKFPLTALGMAAANLETKGYIKYIAEKDSHRVLGATIVASKASDLIGESALAIEMAASLEDIALTVHPHPSYGEAHMEAAASGLKQAIHILNR